MAFTLNANAVYSSLFNFILGQRVYTDNLKKLNREIVAKYSEDVGLFGDQKVYVSVDSGALPCNEWNGVEDTNLLETQKYPTPNVEAVQINKYLQVWVTLESYLTKAGFLTEGTFNDFQSVVSASLSDCKDLHEVSLMQTKIGTLKATSPAQNVAVTLPANDTEDNRRLRAQTIASELADICDGLEDFTRDYNDINYLRSYSRDDITIYWNKEYKNEITKIDLPTIFHKDVMQDMSYSLPARFFGEIQAGGGTTDATNSTKLRAVEEIVYDVSGKKYHLYAGDLLPGNCTYEANSTYIADDKIIAVLVHNDAIKMLKAFTTSTEFFNAKSLGTNRYITFGYGIGRLKAFPFIRIKSN